MFVTEFFSLGILASLPLLPGTLFTRKEGQFSLRHIVTHYTLTHTHTYNDKEFGLSRSLFSLTTIPVQQCQFWDSVSGV